MESLRVSYATAPGRGLDPVGVCERLATKTAHLCSCLGLTALSFVSDVVKASTIAVYAVIPAFSVQTHDSFESTRLLLVDLRIDRINLLLELLKGAAYASEP